MKDRVVFLHGLGSTKHLFDEVQTFINLDKIEVLALDLPDHGETQMLENMSIDLLCSWLNEKIEKSSIIAGHSLGAFVLLAFAFRYPDKVKKIILLDGGYLFSRMFDVSLEDEIEGVKQFVENTKFHTIDDIIKFEKSELKRWSTLLEEATLKRFNRTQDGTYKLIIELNTAIIGSCQYSCRIFYTLVFLVFLRCSSFFRPSAPCLSPSDFNQKEERTFD